MHFHLLRWRMLPVCVEGGRTVLHSPVGFFPRLKMQVYLQRFSCIVAHVATLTRLQWNAILLNLAGFLLGQEDHFFLVPNLTSGSVINYCILPSGVSASGGSWWHDIRSSLYRVSSYSQVGVSSFFVQDTVSYIHRWKKKILPLGRQGHCSVFRSQLLTALPLTISLSFGHSSPAATSAASRQRQAVCTWPGSRTPPAVTKTARGYVGEIIL